ncbi:MAG: PEP-CTERM sorting domain-containing protein [Planctomycetota bacterium]
MKMKSFVAACAVSVAGWSGAQADTFQLDITADGDSRYFDLFSGAFAQIDRGHGGNPTLDGFFSVADETNTLLSGTTQLNIGNEAAFDTFSPTNFVQFGGVDLFPQETDFSGLGSIDYDANTGVVTGATLDVFPFVSDSFSQLAASQGDYATVVSNVVGTVTTVPAGVSGINLTADIAFVYGGAISYDGVLEITGNKFDLFVDEEPLLPLPTGGAVPFRLAWDIEGQVNNLVPEPASMGLVGLGLLVTCARRRRG